MVFDMLDSPRRIGMATGTVAFMFLFPMYFAWMPLADENLVTGGSSGQGEWLVSLSLIHISEPTDKRQSRMPSSA